VDGKPYASADRGQKPLAAGTCATPSGTRLGEWDRTAAPGEALTPRAERDPPALNTEPGNDVYPAMKSLRIPIVGVVLILTSALPALAAASPPDPSWIVGIYDDADFDDVVTLAVSATGVLVPDVPIDLRFVPRSVEVPTVPQAAPEAPDTAPDHSRAPPAS